ncbi:MAG: phosphatidate cytidylyltransferase, partial [Pseudomonadota bacterium]
RPPASRGRSRAVLVAGVVLLSAAWAALVSVHRGSPAGAELTLYLLVLIWGADSGAYFAGRIFGKRKLAPALSPGKTVEGAAGAILAAVLLALFYAWWRQPGTDVGLFSLLSIVVVVVSIAGDLFESLLKRREGVKDSGTLLPGHGGVLDRLDSLLAAAPVYYVGLHLFGVVE